VAPRAVTYHGSTFLDLDVDGVIAGRADLVLVDELAHTRPDCNRRRWEDVAGHVNTADSVGGALGDYFRPANLEALSQLGEAWMTDSADTAGEELLARRGLADPPYRPLVVAGISASRGGERVIRRAAELAAEDDAQLLVVHVNVTDGLAHPRDGFSTGIAMRQSSWPPINAATSSTATCCGRTRSFRLLVRDRTRYLITSSHMCYDMHMGEVASRELRNDTRGLLRRVEAGEDIFIAVDGRRVAVLRPIGSRPSWMSRREFVGRFSNRQADAAMADDIRDLAPDTTDDS